MSRFVLLLRGINVGRNKRVPMAELRTLLQELGCDEVSTLLNSGNALFSAVGRSPDRHARAIASAIEARFGFPVPVVVMAARVFLAAVADNPIETPESGYSRLLAVFAAQPGALSRLAAIEVRLQAGERLHIGQRAAYLYCPGGLLESVAASALLGALGDSPMTTRNWATVLKIRHGVEAGT